MRGFARVLLVVVLAFRASGAQAMGPGPTPVYSEYIQEGSATPISEVIVNFPGAVTYQFSFRPKAAFPQSEAVVHVLSLSGSQLAQGASPGPGQPAVVSFQAPGAGSYRLVLRAKSASSSGQGDLYLNNQAHRLNLPFGGIVLSFPTVTAQDRVEIVSLPSLKLPPLRAYLMQASDPTQIQNAATGGGAAGDISFAVSSARAVALLIGSSNEHTGRARILRNDLGPDHDPDGDGLGSTLEYFLGTCGSLASAGVPGVDCSLLADARDTDGDGISEGWEVLGRRDRTPHQPLPRWGADPRHKDMFAEVDYMRRTQAENTQGRVVRMPEAVARGVARLYADAYTTSPEVRSTNARSIGNPDGVPGISIHLDTGLAPVQAGDERIFGNWGGFNGVDAVSYVDPNGQTQWRGQAASDAWKIQMAQSRRGIFRYHLAYDAGGGSASEGFSVSYNLNSVYLSAHEPGHTLGLIHDGSTRDGFNCKPNYLSVMNYAFSGGAADGVGFAGADESVPQTLNNTRLAETSAIHPSNVTLLRHLKTAFGYNVDEWGGHVDWNRDGTFSQTPVRAVANSKPEGACEFTRRNAQLLPESSKSQSPPVLARLGQRLYAFYVNASNELYYTSSAATWNCSGGSASSCQTAPWLPPVRLLGNVRGADAKKARLGGVDSLVVIALENDGYMAEKRLKLVNGNEVWEPTRRVRVYGKAQPSLAVTGQADRPLYVVFKNEQDVLKTMYLNAQTNAWQDLSSSQTVLLSANASPAIHFSPVNISLTESESERSVPRLWGLFNHRCDGAGSPNVAFEVLVYNESVSRWQHIESDLWPIRQGFSANDRIFYNMDIRGRPSIAWVPNSNLANYPGRAYAAFEFMDPTTQRLHSRLVKSTRNRDLEDGEIVYSAKWMISDFDNTWFYSYGTSLLYEPGVDTHLKSLTALAIDRPETLKRLELRPNTDGIFDADMRAPNDWPMMRNRLCKYTSLMDLSVPPAISPPIACGQFAE
jgi:hypothetical protein